MPPKKSTVKTPYEEDELLEEFLPSQGEVRDFRLEHDFKGRGQRKLVLNARRFYEESKGLQLVLLAIEDVT